jgi:hypothetical protein
MCRRERQLPNGALSCRQTVPAGGKGTGQQVPGLVTLGAGAGVEELGLQPSDDDNRRVLAVLAFLDG